MPYYALKQANVLDMPDVPTSGAYYYVYGSFSHSVFGATDTILIRGFSDGVGFYFGSTTTNFLCGIVYGKGIYFTSTATSAALLFGTDENSVITVNSIDESTSSSEGLSWFNYLFEEVEGFSRTLAKATYTFNEADSNSVYLGFYDSSASGEAYDIISNVTLTYKADTSSSRTYVANLTAKYVNNTYYGSISATGVETSDSDLILYVNNYAFTSGNYGTIVIQVPEETKISNFLYSFFNTNFTVAIEITAGNYAPRALTYAEWENIRNYLPATKGSDGTVTWGVNCNITYNGTTYTYLSITAHDYTSYFPQYTEMIYTAVMALYTTDGEKIVIFNYTNPVYGYSSAYPDGDMGQIAFLNDFFDYDKKAFYFTVNETLSTDNNRLLALFNLLFSKYEESEIESGKTYCFVETDLPVYYNSGPFMPLDRVLIGTEVYDKVDLWQYPNDISINRLAITSDGGETFKIVTARDTYTAVLKELAQGTVYLTTAADETISVAPAVKTWFSAYFQGIPTYRLDFAVSNPEGEPSFSVVLIPGCTYELCVALGEDIIKSNSFTLTGEETALKIEIAYSSGESQTYVVELPEEGGGGKDDVTVNYTDEFTTDSQSGAWRYGSASTDDWNTFTFTQATEKNSDGDGWIADGVEIKADWISADSPTAIAYVYSGTDEVTVSIAVVLACTIVNAKLDLRLGVASNSGTSVSNLAYYGDDYRTSSEEDGGTYYTLTVTATLTLSAGDIVYFIFANANSDDGSAYPQGNLSITLTKVDEDDGGSNE